MKKLFLILFIFFIGFNMSGCTVKDKSDSSAITSLQTTILKEGSGEIAENGDNVEVDYVGTLLDGTQFDSSIDRGKSFYFTLGSGEVIQGWDQGVLGMKVGEKRKLIIPSALGYGSRAVSTIPANSVLVFEVELLSIQ